MNTGFAFRPSCVDEGERHVECRVRDVCAVCIERSARLQAARVRGDPARDTGGVGGHGCAGRGRRARRAAHQSEVRRGLPALLPAAYRSRRDAPERRYFFLHAIINFVIAALSFQDVIYVFSDPLSALASTEVSHWPSSLVFSIHVYHVAFFSNLQWIDWLHHILMVAVGAPLLITGEVGPLMNFNNAFMCGVPGGLDYILLFCVKEGWMKPLMEKRFNSMINVWMRAPFLVCTGTLVLVQHHVQLGSGVPSYVIYTRLFLSLLACWCGRGALDAGIFGTWTLRRACARLPACAPTAPTRLRAPTPPPKKGTPSSSWSAWWETTM